MTKKAIYYPLVAMLICSLCLISCSKDEVPDAEHKGIVTFSFDAPPDDSGLMGLKSTVAKEDAAAVIVTILGFDGDTIYYQEELELFNLNGSYITKSLLVPEGRYLLTQFLVLDENNNVIYLTPMQGSEYAYLVEQPLPIEFGVQKDNVTKLVPEVISTDCSCTAADFGYVGFDFNVVELFCILLNVQVFDETGENYVFVDAHLTVEGDGEVLYTGELPARTDSLKLPEGYQEYRFIVSKEGVADLDTAFTREELMEFVDIPLVVLWPFSVMFDVEGNMYPVVTICGQVWMASNLRTKTRNDGTTQPNPTPAGFSPEYLDYGDPQLEDPYGLLYSHHAHRYVPNGWHIPSDDEWMQLETCLGMNASVLDDIGTRGTTQGDALKPGGWTGFNALYGGRAHWRFLIEYPNPGAWYDLDYLYVNEEAYFRTSSTNLWDEFYPDYIYRAVGRAYSGINRNAYHSRHVVNYYSVRLVKD